MDLNRLIKQIEKYTKRSLEFSMREFRQLEWLKKDILKIEEIKKKMNYKGELEYWETHYQQLEECSERIERRLNVWINKLESLITKYESDFSPRDKKYFELWKHKIEDCKNNLVRILSKGGELSKSIEEKASLWEVERKINEACGTNKTLIELLSQFEVIRGEIEEGSLDTKKALDLIKIYWQVHIKNNFVYHGTSTIYKEYIAKRGLITGDRPYLKRMILFLEVINKILREKKDYYEPSLVDLLLKMNVVGVNQINLRFESDRYPNWTARRDEALFYATDSNKACGETLQGIKNTSVNFIKHHEEYYKHSKDRTCLLGEKELRFLNATIRWVNRLEIRHRPMLLKIRLSSPIFDNYPYHIPIGSLDNTIKMFKEKLLKMKLSFNSKTVSELINGSVSSIGEFDTHIKSASAGEIEFEEI